MTSDPSYGIEYLQKLLRRYGLENRWCFLAQDGTAHGMSRECLAKLCRESDLYLNLSNINWLPELEECPRRVLVDTDPVFTQIGAHGLGGPYSRYHALFTYGENVHRTGCSMPTAGERWLPTRQPIVLDMWQVVPGDRSAPFTTIMNWSPLGDRWHDDQLYGQKDRTFEPFFTLPRLTHTPMQLAVTPPGEIRAQLTRGGWHLADPLHVTRDPSAYQNYLRSSRAEFSVAKHGYVTTRCGWFSERSAAYLASGRPIVVQDTGFRHWLETDIGVIAFATPEEACVGIAEIGGRYEAHCRAARQIAEEYFDARRVLVKLIEQAMTFGGVSCTRAGEGAT